MGAHSERIAATLDNFAHDLKQDGLEDKTIHRAIRDWLDEVDPEQQQFIDWIRNKLEKSVPDIMHEPRTDELRRTKYELMGKMHILCFRAQAERIYTDIAIEQQKRADIAEATISTLRAIVEGWAAERGQELCWWDSDYLEQLAEMLGVEAGYRATALPPRFLFEKGCRRFQNELYGHQDACLTHVETLRILDEKAKQWGNGESQINLLVHEVHEAVAIALRVKRTDEATEDTGNAS